MKNKHCKFYLQLFFVAIYIILCISANDLVIDDAYITFQYAKNLAEFGKPWYNLDPYFQGNGQTSLLWMWILSIFQYIGLKQDIFFLLINIGLGSYLIIKLIDFLKFDKKNLLFSVFNATLLCFFTYWLFLNSLHGLETVLTAFVLYFFFKNWDNNENYYSLLLVLIRPEFLLFQIFWIFDTKIGTRYFFKRMWISSIGLAIFCLYYFVFFDFYILLPFLFKSTFGTYTIPQFSVYLGMLLIFLMLCIALYNEKKFLILIPLNILLFYYTFNVQSYSSGIFARYYFPLLILYAVFGKFSATYQFFNKPIRLLTKVILIFAVLRMVDLSNNFYHQKLQIAFENIGYYGSYKNLIKTLNPKDKVTISDAGFTAYFSDATCYDGVGLNDATIMLARKHNDRIAYRQYIINRHINVITLASVSPKQFVARSEPENFAYTSLHLEKYKPYKIFPMDKGFYLFVYHIK